MELIDVIKKVHGYSTYKLELWKVAILLIVVSVVF